ncbi:unnamed protein product [Arctogadus glacialis]
MLPLLRSLFLLDRSTGWLLALGFVLRPAFIRPVRIREKETAVSLRGQGSGSSAVTRAASRGVLHDDEWRYTAEGSLPRLPVPQHGSR